MSFTASMIATDAVLALLVVRISLAAPVLPSTTTAVGVTLLSAGFAGMTTLKVQVKVAPAGKAAAVPLLATQLPDTTVAVAPVVSVLAVQVALIAVLPAAALVQVMVPVTVEPGAAVAGRPVIALVRSAAAPTVMVAVAVSHIVLGDGSVQILYGTV